MSAPAENTLIELKDIEKTFDSGLNLFKNLHLKIHEGEFICLLGPSGSGKSTLLRFILGLDEPTRGQVLRRKPISSSAGVVFQEPRLLPWLTLSQNVHLPRKIRGDRFDLSVVEKAFGTARLSLDFLNYYPHQISGGMKMRASLARALISDPQILIMDEPFSALDEPTRFSLQEELRQLFESRAGQSVLFVTHSIQEAVFLADRIIVLDEKGSLKSEISPVFEGSRNRDYRFSNEAAQLMRQVAHELSLEPQEVLQ